MPFDVLQSAPLDLISDAEALLCHVDSEFPSAGGSAGGTVNELETESDGAEEVNDLDSDDVLADLCDNLDEESEDGDAREASEVNSDGSVADVDGQSSGDDVDKF